MLQEKKETSPKVEKTNNKSENVTEKSFSKESLEIKVDKCLNYLNEEKTISKKDTEEVLSLINGLENDLSVVLLKEKEETENEINNLDTKKELVITEAESVLVNERNELNGLEKESELDTTNNKERLQVERKTLELREMREVALISYEKIRQRAIDLGIIISDFQAEKIDFKTKDNYSAGSYSCGSDNIKITSNSAKVIIHEELHFVGAVDNRSGKNSLGENRLSKTGFTSTWKEKDKSEETHENLRSLNEAVTEKMAQEIFLNNKEPIYLELLKIDPEIENLNNNLANKERDLALKEFEAEAEETYNYNQEYSMESQSFEDFVQDRKQKIDSVYNSKLGGFKNQEILADHSAYKDEVSILDVILDKLSRERAKIDQVSVDNAKAIEWKEMQRAYLKGETIYLRKIEKVIGPNILREFNNIDIRNVKHGKESSDVFKEKVKKIIERINS